jgi:universal stress protein E
VRLNKPVEVGTVHAIRRILVAVKNPALPMPPAVAKAAQLARALDAELVLFHAIAAPLCLEGDLTLLSAGLAGAERDVRMACRERLETIARRLRRKGLKVVSCVQWDYPVYEAVIREAIRVGADLIVAEQHAGRHTAARWLRLADWELLRLSPVPVLLIKRAGVYRRPLVLAAVDPDHTYSKPAQLDGEILRAGSAIATALRGTLHAVHAYMPLPLAAVANSALTDEEVARVQTQSARIAGTKLERLVHKVGIPESRRHLIGRHPTDAIEQVAAETRSPLVVMGAIARSGLKSLLIGNTAEKVLDHLTSDLLVIKPPGLIKRPPRARRPLRYSVFGQAPAVY